MDSALSTRRSAALTGVDSSECDLGFRDEVGTQKGGI
jgi:hypothetical protein